uniref:Helicase POLQ-like n=1 Tax=Parastrongyloides trichosuri TaxID=131310 RepID=A0A0N4ZRX6_PARTI
MSNNFNVNKRSLGDSFSKNISLNLKNADNTVPPSPARKKLKSDENLLVINRPNGLKVITPRRQALNRTPIASRPILSEFNDSFDFSPEVTKALTPRTSPRLKFSKNIGRYPNPKYNILTSKERDVKNLTTEDVFKAIGLSEAEKSVYKEKRKICDLYAWQKECMTIPELLDGKNYILSLQTGAGKTLAAELLMLRETLVKKRNCIMILPYVAIVQEKIMSLSLFEELGIHVEEYAATKGRIPPTKRQKKSSVYVATIEKANILINSLIKEKRINEIGLIVVDELHMISEKCRGIVIEQLIYKYIKTGSGQIIGMSATLGSVETLCKFMKAAHYSSDFRPVELVERVKIGNNIYNVTSDGDLELHTTLTINPKFAKFDCDGIIELIKDVIPKRSVIIFCPTKQNCENVCKMIAKFVPKALKKPCSKREEIINSIKNENDGEIEEAMEIGIRAGIAYHHSGLSGEERQLIESGFHEGTLYVICATSTLAAGVNLPARRVIIKNPMVGIEFIEKSQYLQMIGRAGRAGFDDKGESITIVNGSCEKRFKEMLKTKLTFCKSQMNDEASFESFILELIYLNISQTVDQIFACSLETLHGIQNNDSIMTLASNALNNLQGKKMIEVKNEKFIKTFLGEATFAANFSPDCAELLNGNLLQDLNQGVIFSSYFHMLLTLIPYNIGTKIDWDIFHCEYKKLCLTEKLMLEKVNILEHDIIFQIESRKAVEPGTPAMRLYLTFMMMDIWSKITIVDVSKKYKVPKGWLQSTLQSVCSQAQRIQRFSESLEKLWPLKILLPHIVSKLNECKNTELAPLMNLDCIKFGRAKMLFDKGYKTVKSIADANPMDLVKCIDQLSLFQAVRIVKSAKTAIDQLLNEQKEQRIQFGVIDNNV